MNIVLINHYAGTMRHGMEYRPYYLAREWVRTGHRVQILAASYSHLRARQPQLGGRSVLDESIDGIAYRWYRTPAYRGNGLGRVRNMLAFLWAIWRDARHVAQACKPNVVIASSTYPMDIWPARRIARFAGAKLIYEVHDLWPLTPIELGGMSKWHPFILWVQWAESYAYRHADTVVSMLPRTLEYMVSKGLNATKWHYVPNGINEKEWSKPSTLPEEIAAELNRVHCKGLAIVGYAGGHGLANALDTLLDAAKGMQTEVEVVIVGAGPERERLMRRVGDERIQNVTMLPPLPKLSIPSFLAKIDIAFIGAPRQKLYKFGISPNKLMDYMMARKPIVMAIEAGNDPVTEAGCGRTVPPEDPPTIRKAILELAALSPEKRAALGARGRTYILAHHSYPVLAKQFLDTLARA